MAPRTARDDLATVRRTKAVHLRLLGRTYQQIADTLLPCPAHEPGGLAGCSACTRLYATRSGAMRAVQTALAEAYALDAESREELRRQQVGRLELLLTKAMAEALGQGEGRHEAMRNSVRLLDRYSRLLGLDAPARLQVSNELDEQIEALVAQLGQLPVPEPTEPRS